MNPDEVKRLIETGIPGSQVMVNGDGRHFDAIVVADDFDGQTMVKQQQRVYATVNAHIASGDLHALSIKTFTVDAWQAAGKPTL